MLREDDAVPTPKKKGNITDNATHRGHIRSMDDVVLAIGWHRFGPQVEGRWKVVDRYRLGF
jgi:hypothetical protein